MVLNLKYESNQTISSKTCGGMVIALNDGPSQRMRAAMKVTKRLQRKCIIAIAEKCRNDSSTDIAPDHFPKGIEFARIWTPVMSNGSELLTMEIAADICRQTTTIENTLFCYEIFETPWGSFNRTTTQSTESYERRAVEPGCCVISQGGHFVFMQVGAWLHQSDDWCLEGHRVFSMDWLIRLKTKKEIVS
jgi:hypothetical protein